MYKTDSAAVREGTGKRKRDDYDDDVDEPTAYQPSDSELALLMMCLMCK